MRLEELREFVVFARYLNFSKAAKKLYISQPLLSYHIANIEKDTGLSLVDRKAPISLTAAGEVFLEGVEDLLRCYDDTLEKKPGRRAAATRPTHHT